MLDLERFVLILNRLGIWSQLRSRWYPVSSGSASEVSRSELQQPSLRCGPGRRRRGDPVLPGAWLLLRLLLCRSGGRTMWDSDIWARGSWCLSRWRTRPRGICIRRGPGIGAFGIRILPQMSWILSLRCLNLRRDLDIRGLRVLPWQCVSDRSRSMVVFSSNSNEIFLCWIQPKPAPTNHWDTCSHSSSHTAAACTSIQPSWRKNHWSNNSNTAPAAQAWGIWQQWPPASCPRFLCTHWDWSLWSPLEPYWSLWTSIQRWNGHLWQLKTRNLISGSMSFSRTGHRWNWAALALRRLCTRGPAFTPILVSSVDVVHGREAGSCGRARALEWARGWCEVCARSCWLWSPGLLV